MRRSAFARSRSMRFGATLVLALAVMATAACHKKTPREMLDEANQLLQSKDILSAEMKYEDLLERHPEAKEANDARLGLAICYIQDHEYDKAREQMDKVIKATGGPDSEMGFRAMFLKLDSYMMEKKPNLALKEAYATSMTLRTGKPEARQALALKIGDLYAATDQTTKALEMNLQAIRDWPKSPDLHMAALTRIVKLYSKVKNPQAAIKVNEEYLSTHPDSQIKPQVLFSIGSIQKYLGEKAQAETTYNAAETELRAQVGKALGLEAKGDKMLELAQFQMARDDLQGSSKTLRQIIKEFPNSEKQKIARMQMSDLALMQDNPNESIGILQQLARENPESEIGAAAGQRIMQIQAMLRQKAQATTGTLPMQTSGTLPLRATTGTLTQTAPPAAAPARPQSATTAPATAATPAGAPPAGPPPARPGAAKPVGSQAKVPNAPPAEPKP